MVLRIKNFNILGVHWKIWIFGGFTNIDMGDRICYLVLVCVLDTLGIVMRLAIWYHVKNTYELLVGF